MDRIATRARLLALAVSLLPTLALGAPVTTTYPWAVPDNVRIVQKAPVDNVRTFATVAAALASIKTASSTNRFLVKVMPGTYTEAVTLPSWVTLEGSGRDATTLTTPAGSPSAFTVSAASESRIENLTLAYAGAFGGAAAVVIQTGARVTIDRAKLAMPAEILASAITLGAGSRLELLGSEVVLANGGLGGGDMAIDAWWGPNGVQPELLVRNCRFDIQYGRGSHFVAILMSGPTEIVDTTFDLVATYGGVELWDGDVSPLELHGCTVRIRNDDLAYGGMDGLIHAYGTTVLAKGNVTYAATLRPGSVIQNSTFVSDQGGLNLVGATDIRNSTVGGQTIGIDGVAPQWRYGPFRAANSQILGGHVGVSGFDRVTNCVDGNFDPIPNL